MNIQGKAIGVGNGRSHHSIVPGSYDTGVRNGTNGYDLQIDSIPRTSMNTLLQNVGNDHLIRLRQFLKRVNLTKDQYLYQQDDKIDNIFFPETAVISEFQILEDGRMIEVGIIGSEGAVGIASAFNACRAPNCTQVCVAGTALAIGRDIFEREVASDPRLQMTLHNYINGQIKQLSQRVVCNTFHSVEQRFCSWLLTLQGRSRRDKFKITHEHVARVLGVHRPSVTCIAQGLRERKLIDYGRARLVIANKPGIERLACRCSADLNGVRTAAH
jgi:CRP-like cAMP-binding protein